MATIRKGTRLVFTIIPLLIALGIIGNIVFRLVQANQGQEVTDTSTMARYVCSANQKIKNAADYQSGSGQHPFLLAYESTVVQTEQTETDYKPTVYTTHDPSKVSLLDVTNVSDPSKVQVVGCMTRQNETKQDKVCSFDNGVSLQLYDPHYQLSIYSAKTHQLLKQVSIKSIDAASYECPSQVYYNPGQKRIYLDPDSTTLEQYIRQYGLQS